MIISLFFPPRFFEEIPTLSIAAYQYLEGSTGEPHNLCRINVIRIYVGPKRTKVLLRSFGVTIKDLRDFKY